MKKNKNSGVADLAESVGEFIRYWGFRNIHGEIWTLVYLSEKSLSGAELSKALGASKALVSPALKELEAEGLIFQTESENAKTKRYKATEDVIKVIQGVLKRREAPMIRRVSQKLTRLQSSSKESRGIDNSKLKNLENMVNKAQMALLLLTESEEIWS